MRTVLMLFCMVFSVQAGVAQQEPDVSPAASISQRIGITDVVVTYHRPGVKGRTIWGALVPYGEVWRAGANENTTISFSDPVSIGGHTLAGGTYGLHMIPGEREWTIIFSTNATSWGSFSYDKAEDALRAAVRPEAADFSEWLGYSFDHLTDSSAVLVLRWERVRLPLRIDVDLASVTLYHLRHEYLRGLASFGWQGWNNAANFCVQRNVNLDEGLTWVDRSLRMNRNFDNLWVKSEILRKQGRSAQADSLQREAYGLATEAQVNAKGYQYLQNGELPAAIALFTRNVQAHPESWNVYDSLAEAWERSGDIHQALSCYQIALKKVDSQTQKDRLVRTIERLQRQ